MKKDRDRTISCLLIVMLAFISMCTTGCIGAMGAATIAEKMYTYRQNQCARVDTKLEPSLKLNEDLPLKADEKITGAIKRIAVLPMDNQIEEMDHKIIYSAALDVLVEELNKSKRFTITNPSTIRKKQQELGINIDSSMSQEERESNFSKICKAIKCDAILAINQKNKEANRGSQLVKYVYSGQVDNPMVMAIEVHAAKDGKTIYVQSHDYIYSHGERTVQNMSHDEIVRMLQPVIQPLAENILMTF